MRSTWIAVLVVMGCATSDAESPNAPVDDTQLPPGDSFNLGVPSDTCTVAAGDKDLIVATERGRVRGKRTDGVTRFLGIPFGAPPTGARRFAPAAIPPCWSNVRDTTQYAEQCVQRDFLGQLGGKEDCLYLNVWTPSAALRDNKPRPVMFWIYGGGNVGGSTNASALGGNLYDGQKLAEERDVIVVSAAYRVGALGFLAHPALTAESPVGSSGAYGVLDQIVALKWVQRNIDAFGGDPSRVMAFGESAGAANTCTLLASPLAAGLFSTAAMQSGFCPGLPLQKAEQLGIARATALGCSDAACLRAAKIEDLADGLTADSSTGSLDALTAQTFMPAAPIDGWVLDEHPYAALAHGAYNKVPFMIGSNRDESAIFLLTKSVLTCGQYEDEIRAAYPAFAGDVLALYPCSWTNPKQALIAAQTDSFFTCPARRIARLMSAAQQAPVHRYYFTFAPLSSQATGGAAHTAEIPYVFGTVSSPATPTQNALKTRMMGYWTRFAASTDPNGAGEPFWTTYSSGGSLQLDADTLMVGPINTNKCDFWDSKALY